MRRTVADQCGCLCVWLQQKVKDWEQYEGEKTSLLQYLKKAESELEKPPETLAQDSAQKDLQSKKVNINSASQCD